MSIFGSILLLGLLVGGHSSPEVPPHSSASPELELPPIEAAAPIGFVSLEASRDIVEGFWNTELDSYRMHRDSIPERTFIRFSSEASLPYGVDVRSGFGGRRGRMHKGVDLAVPSGTDVTAVLEGVVRVSTYHNGYGNIVVIRHPNGLETCYAHLSKRLVGRGDVVAAGDVIARSGSTGRSTGPHLHFETLFCGRHFDPELLFDFSSGTLHSDGFILRREMLVR